ncbi:hypothetical protein L9F63_009338, partial [Diploptera punctata]
NLASATILRENVRIFHPVNVMAIVTAIESYSLCSNDLIEIITAEYDVTIRNILMELNGR